MSDNDCPLFVVVFLQSQLRILDNRQVVQAVHSKPMSDDLTVVTETTSTNTGRHGSEAALA